MSDLNVYKQYVIDVLRELMLFPAHYLTPDFTILYLKFQSGDNTSRMTCAYTALARLLIAY